MRARLLLRPDPGRTGPGPPVPLGSLLLRSLPLLMLLMLLMAGAGLWGESQPGTAPDHLWTPRSSFTDSLGQTHTRLVHSYKGIRVLGSEAIRHEAAPGVPMLGPAWEGEAQHPTWSLSIRPRLTVHEAQQRVREDLGSRGAGATLAAATLVILPVAAEFLGREPAQGEEPNAEDVVRYVAGHVLAYLLPTAVPVHHGLERWDYWVDARTGRILQRLPEDLHVDAPAVGTGYTYHSGEVPLDTMRTEAGTFQLLDPLRGGGGVFGHNAVTDMTRSWGDDPGTLVRNRTNAWGDGSPEIRGADPNGPNGQTVAADAAVGLRDAWDYFLNVHGRKGFDGRGTATSVRVHGRGEGYDNAAWDKRTHSITIYPASRLLAFAEPTTLGHEFTHGVTETTAGLIYLGESGGLDEATSDIFGHLIATYTWSGGGSGREPSALIGDKDVPWTVEHVVAADLTPEVTRYLDQPSRDGLSPDAWNPHLAALDPHHASGPMNRAFYFLSKGASPLPGAATHSRFLPEGMVGIGNDKAARIWYHTLTTQLRPDATYLDARRGAIRSAGALFGVLSKEDFAVREAFGAINVGDSRGRSEEGGAEPILAPGFVRAAADVRQHILTLSAETRDPWRVDWVLFLVDDLLVGKVRMDRQQRENRPALVLDASRWLANGDHVLKARVLVHGLAEPIDSAAVPFTLRMDRQQLLADPGLEAIPPMVPKWGQGSAPLFQRDLQVAAHGGDQCVRFSRGLHTLSQRVHLPEGMASLTFNFWARVREDVVPQDGDELKVQVRSAPPQGTAPGILATLATLGPEHHHLDWVGRSFDLARFAGRTVELALVARVGAHSNTVFDVDDLTVLAASRPMAAVTVTPAFLELKAGGVSAGPLAASVRDSEDPAVAWRVREAAGGTLDLGNRYHAPGEPGIYHAVATSRSDPFAEAEISIRVLPSVVFPTPSIRVVTGATVALHPVLAPGATPGFFIREPEGGTVSSTGAMEGFSYTAPRVPGTYHLDAVDGSAPANRATLTLVVGAPVQSAIEPATVALAPGASFQFLLDPYREPQAWSVVGGAGHGTVSEWGEYTAPSRPGVYRVQCAVGAMPPAFATVTVR